jgi:type IV secretion system protein VirD4
MLQGGETAYDLAVLLDTQKEMNRMAHEEIAAFLSHAEQSTRPGVLSTAVSYLKAFASRRVAESLAKTTFSLADFVEGKPLTIYIIVPPDRIASHRSLLRLWIGTLLKAGFARKVIPSLPTVLFLDECGQLGRFRLLQNAITVGRGYGMRCWTIWQDRAQIEEAFPEGWRTLINNCALQVFGGVTPWFAQQWSEWLGCSRDTILNMGPTDQFVLFPHGKVTSANLVDYLEDELFAGLYDPNQFYSRICGRDGRDAKCRR